LARRKSKAKQEEEFFEALAGFATLSMTRLGGDYGADLVLSKDGKRIVVQAKRYSKNVGLKAVQEVRGAGSHYGASAVWVITNRDYT
jgi:restriction system protein